MVGNITGNPHLYPGFVKPTGYATPMPTTTLQHDFPNPNVSVFLLINPGATLRWLFGFLDFSFWFRDARLRDKSRIVVVVEWLDRKSLIELALIHPKDVRRLGEECHQLKR